MANLTPAGGRLATACRHKNRITRVLYASANCEQTVFKRPPNRYTWYYIEAITPAHF